MNKNNLLFIPSSFRLHPSLWVCHLFGTDVLVELLAGEEAEFDCGLAQADALLVRVLGDPGGVVVADVWVERRDEHERVVKVLVNARAVEFYPADAEFDEAAAGVLEQTDGVEQVVNHHGVEDVQLEGPLRAGEAYRRVVTQDLHGDHRQRLRLRRVDLARHDRGARLVLRQNQFAYPGARPRREPAHVVRDLHERTGEGLEGAAGEDYLVVGGERRELVRVRLEGQARQLGYLRGGALSELRVRVESRADGGAADGEVVESGQSHLQTLDVAFEQGGPAPELLADREGRRVLQVRAPDLDDVAELARLRVNRVAQASDFGDELVHLLGGGDVHGGGERVVRRLRHVHVVVRVDGPLAPQLAAGDLDGAVRDDLVGVHVCLRAAARLPDAQGEVLVQLPLDHLVRRAHDEPRLVGGELAQLLVDDGGGLLQDAERAYHLARHRVVADAEVVERALGLRAPVAVGGDLDLAHRVALRSRPAAACVAR